MEVIHALSSLLCTHVLFRSARRGKLKLGQSLENVDTETTLNICS